MIRPMEGVTEWRGIPGHPNYAAGSNGVIMTFRGQYGKGPRALTPHSDATGYQRVNIAGRARLTHRLVAAAFSLAGMIDHIDRNRNNPSLVNLRSATPSQNGANMRTRNKLGIKGVHPSYGGRYRACIRVNGKLRHLGSFSNTQDAQLAYQSAASVEFGDFACFESVRKGTP